ncbi:MAG: proline--tRNA ligase [Candidatus Saccharimonadales bacterium]|nr:MAG: proline--tRNA ligase [Candidatus Saccharibacteria bacterium]
MKVSQLFTKTLKEAPADEVAKNAQLLIRAGYVHKEIAGVYAYLPLGLRVVENIKKIVREEMDAAGGQELLMTTLQPSDIWQKTNRWDDAVVDNWFKTKLLNGTELGVGLTHEEPIVDAAMPYITSYKDLPKSVYQIGAKFRNEKRAKSGVLRGREFIMKDMYTFARDQRQHEEVYEQIAAAYHKVYERLGIGDSTFRVKADGGIFTKRFSDEFQTLSPIGEDTIFHVPDTSEYYNREVAPSKAPDGEASTDEQLAMEACHTPGVVGVEQLADVLGVPVARTVKTMLYMVDGAVVAVAVRGDYSVSEVKLRMALQATAVALADADTVREVTGAEVGFAGLLGLPEAVRWVVDDSVASLQNFELGANKTDYHNKNVNWDRDLPRPEQFYDVKEAKEGDINPASGKVYEVMKAVEVGNIFPLETKYTDAFDMFYTDEQGDRQPIIMGCYGIGVSRLLGVLAEHFSDERGLVWPDAVAPYRLYIAQLGNDEAVASAAEKLCEIAQSWGVSVLYDDTDKRPGEKFADADLLGIPHRIVISPKTIEAGTYEYKARTSEATEMVSIDRLKNILTQV